jgi:hypothetical protein
MLRADNLEICNSWNCLAVDGGEQGYTQRHFLPKFVGRDREERLYAFLG